MEHLKKMEVCEEAAKSVNSLSALTVRTVRWFFIMFTLKMRVFLSSFYVIGYAMFVQIVQNMLQREVHEGGFAL